MRHNPPGLPAQVPATPGQSCQQGGYLEPGPQAIHFRLTLPDTRIMAGIFSLDPLERLLGCSLTHILEPMMTGPVVQRPSPAGRAVNVYPLALPLGQGLSLNLGTVGELGFFNASGSLRLSMPWAFLEWVLPALRPYLIHGPASGLSAGGAARVAFLWLALPPGMRACVPLPVLGELGLEVG